MQCTDCQEMLNSYIDGELMPEEAESVRQHIASCAVCSSELQSISSSSRFVKENLERYPAPDVLRARIHGSLSQPMLSNVEVSAKKSVLSRWPWIAAAGIAIAFASSAATYSVVSRQIARRSAADEVLSSHVRSLMPGHLTDVASTNQHNVKPWFNGRVNLSPMVPALDSSGFNLIGGRLDYIHARPVAAVVYGIRQHLINVYSWPDDGADIAPTSVARQGYHLVHWRKGGVTYWAASDLNSAELGKFVTLFSRE